MKKKYLTILLKAMKELKYEKYTDYGKKIGKLMFTMVSEVGMPIEMAIVEFYKLAKREAKSELNITGKKSEKLCKNIMYVALDRYISLNMRHRIKSKEGAEQKFGIADDKTKKWQKQNRKDYIMYADIIKKL